MEAKPQKKKTESHLLQLSSRLQLAFIKTTKIKNIKKKIASKLVVIINTCVESRKSGVSSEYEYYCESVSTLLKFISVYSNTSIVTIVD